MHWRLRAPAVGYVLGWFAMCSGCASINAEREGVRTIAEQHLECSGDDVVARVDDEDLSVRHWIASCKYQNVRITCSKRGCSNDVEWVHMLCESPPELRGRSSGGGAATGPSSQVDDSPIVTR